MADITATLNTCLQDRGARPIRHKTYDLNAINLFLQEAYSINSRIAELTRELRAIRPEYLSDATSSQQRARRRPVNNYGQESTASHDRKRVLTANDREAIDANAKQLLRELNSAINGLKQAEEIRLQAADSVALSKRARGGLGALGRWAAGGAVTAKSPEEEQEEAARKTVAATRESVILYLQRKLEEAGREQSSMMDQRLSKEVQKSKSVLAQSTASSMMSHLRHDSNGTPAIKKSQDLNRHDVPDAANTDSFSPQQNLTAEQLQVFEQENHELLRHYEAQLDQIKTAEKSILEISELHSTLHANLQQQSEHIDQLVQDSYLTTENLGKGNKELKRASERRSTAQAVFYSTVAFCSFLVIWDLFT